MTRAKLFLAAAFCAAAGLPPAAAGESGTGKAPALDEALRQRVAQAFARADLVAVVKVTEVGKAQPPGEGLEGDEAQFQQIFAIGNMWDKIKKRQVAVEVKELIKNGKGLKDLKAIRFRAFTSLATGKELVIVTDLPGLAKSNPFKAHYRNPSYPFTLAQDGTAVVFLLAAEKAGEDGQPAATVWMPAGPLASEGTEALLAYLRDMLKRAAEWENPPKLSAEDQAAVKKLIAELGSDTFAVREAATQSLIAKGCAVRPLVEEALKAGGDPELKQRAEKVLETLKPEALKAKEAETIPGGPDLN